MSLNVKWQRKRDPIEKAGREKGTQWRRLVEKKGPNGEGSMGPAWVCGYLWQATINGYEWGFLLNSYALCSVLVDSRNRLESDLNKLRISSFTNEHKKISIKLFKGQNMYSSKIFQVYSNFIWGQMIIRFWSNIYCHIQR